MKHKSKHEQNHEQDNDARYHGPVKALLASPDYRPMRSRDIARVLGVPRSGFPEFRGQLEKLRLAGEVEKGGDSLWRDPQRPEKTLVGVLDIAMAGHAFLLPDDPDEADVFVPPDGMADAFDGDRVRVVVGESDRRDRRPQGTVVEVLERARTRIVAVMLPDGKAVAEDARRRFEFAMAVGPGTSAKSASQAAKSQRRRRHAERDGLRLSTRRVSAGDLEELPQPGMKVLLEVVSWPDSREGARANVVEVLGPSGDPDTETAAILAQYEAPGPFPAEVLHEARRLDRELPPEELARRLDCTGIVTCTIDPVDARDFDDALSYEKTADGEHVVYVHIADVAHYVRPGSVLDAEARDRSTSIYLPERVIPMLPEEISNDICSLRPNEVRPAKTVRLVFDAEGRRTNFSIHRSFIRSDRRFAYEEVRDILDKPEIGGEFGRENPELMQCLLGLRSLAGQLRQNRLDDGSIELNLDEYRVVVDREGVAQGLDKVEHDFSHQLVEEFMLAANRALAEWAAKNGLPALHRQHAPPKEDRVEELSEFLAACGYPFKPPFQRKKLMQIIAKVHGRPEEHAINLMILKSFQQAVYGPDADVGHFALNFSKYMHFTSPIRRYPDLHLHQMLDAAFAVGSENADKLPKKLRQAVLPAENLENLGFHTSGRERRAMRIEEEVKDFRRLELLSKASAREFDAVVTGIKKFGVFVEVVGYFVEGLLPRAMLAAKGFSTREELPPPMAGKRKPARKRLAGDPGFHLGQVVRVRLGKVDLAARRCDLIFLGAE